MCNTPDESEVSSRPPNRGQWLSALPWEKVLTWAVFLGLVCLLRHLLLVIFLTFMLCYLVRSVINAVKGRLWADRERPGLERLLVLLLFAVLAITVGVAASFVGPFLVGECEELAARASTVDGEYELHRMLGKTVGAYLFRQKYGGPGHDAYQQAVAEFGEKGHYGATAYREFPAIETDVGGTIDARVEAEARARLTAELARKPASGQAFEQWLAQQKSSVQNTPGDTASLAQRQRQWRSAALAAQLAELRRSPGYQEQRRSLYDERRRADAKRLPYDFDVYEQLKAAYPKGEAAFVEVLDRLTGPRNSTDRNEVQAAFERQKQIELADQWWATSHLADLVRVHAEEDLDMVASSLSRWIGDFVASLMGLPTQILTVLFLSFFILIDYPNLRRGIESLQHSRLSFLYDDLFPGLVKLGNLVGRAFLAQGIVSFCDAVLVFFVLTIIGIENALLLSLIVLVFSFVPLIGVILSAIPIVLMALVQPGGSLDLAVCAVASILLIHLIEATILSPRIVGRMLHLHPVLGIVVLGIGEHFFGIWGLLLAYPVTVYLATRVLDQSAAPGQPAHRSAQPAA